MVTISFTKHQLFLITQALEGHSYSDEKDKFLQMDIIKILTKFRKSMRLRYDKAHISIIMDEVQKLIPEKKRPLVKK